MPSFKPGDLVRFKDTNEIPLRNPVFSYAHEPGRVFKVVKLHNPDQPFNYTVELDAPGGHCWMPLRFELVEAAPSPDQCPFKPGDLVVCIKGTTGLTVGKTYRVSTRTSCEGHVCIERDDTDTKNVAYYRDRFTPHAQPNPTTCDPVSGSHEPQQESTMRLFICQPYLEHKNENGEVVGITEINGLRHVIADSKESAADIVRTDLLRNNETCKDVTKSKDIRVMFLTHESTATV